MKVNKKPALVILTGPTAVGKTELSINLAKRIGGEIISADSMQVYRYMDIGSAKVMPGQMDGVMHHLIDILEPTQEFNVVLFQQLARKAMDEIYGRGHIPVVAGGTGFYIQALLYDIDFTDNDEDTALRRELEETARTQGSGVLYERLRQIDPESCETIHAHNIKRVIRAIEFYQKTGMKISQHNKIQRQNASPYNFAYFVLNEDRDRLYSRIESRVDEMMESGLAEEVRRLRDMGCTADMVSMQGLGYRQILACLEGQITMDEAVRLIKRDTRHFAKRQLTWFRREKDTIMIDKPDYGYDNNRILDYMTSILTEKSII